MQASELWGYIVGLVGLLVGMAGWFRNAKCDTTQQAGWMGKVDAKLDHISVELGKLGNILERVALVEHAAKSVCAQLENHIKYEHNKGD